MSSFPSIIFIHQREVMAAAQWLCILLILLSFGITTLTQATPSPVLQQCADFGGVLKSGIYCYRSDCTNSKFGTCCIAGCDADCCVNVVANGPYCDEVAPPTKSCRFRETPDPDCNGGYGQLIDGKYCFRSNCPVFGGSGCSGDCCMDVIDQGPTCDQNGPPLVSCLMDPPLTVPQQCTNWGGTFEDGQYCFRSDCYPWFYLSTSCSNVGQDCCLKFSGEQYCDEGKTPPSQSCQFRKTPDEYCNNGYGIIKYGKYCFREDCPVFGGNGCNGDCCQGVIDQGPTCQENAPPIVSCLMTSLSANQLCVSFGGVLKYGKYCFRGDCPQFGGAGCNGDCCDGVVGNGPYCDQVTPPSESCRFRKTPDPNCDGGYGTVQLYNGKKYCFRSNCPQFGGSGCDLGGTDCCFGVIDNGPSCKENGPPLISCLMDSASAANAINPINDEFYGLDINPKENKWDYHNWLNYLWIGCVALVFNIFVYIMVYIFCIKPKVKTGSYQYKWVNNKQSQVMDEEN